MKSYLYGLLAALGLLTLYFLTMTVLSGWGAAVEQFRALWYLMLPAAAGFGVQVGLYTTLSQGAGRHTFSKHRHGLGTKDYKNIKKVWTLAMQEPRYADLSAEGIQSAQAPVAAGGTSAGISMLVCCSHHATDVLPFLGLSGISIFLTRYQIPLLTVSLAINAVGIIVMLKHLRKMY